MSDFSDLLSAFRAARALLGLRQDELAERAGVTRQMIARLENEDRSVSLQTVERVRLALEKAGVVFLAETAELGTGVARKKRR